MNTTSKRKILGILGLLFFIPWLSIQCGGSSETASSSGSSGSGGGTGASISGTVEAPVSTSASISVGQSLSKGVSKSLSGGDADNSDSSDNGAVQISVSKASEVPAGGGTVTATTLAGTVLDTGTIDSSGKLVGLSVDATQAKADGSNTILLDVTLPGGKKLSKECDASSIANGSTLDCKTTNTASTLVHQEVLNACGATPDALSALASKISSGDCRPQALLKTFENVDTTATGVSTSDASGTHAAMKQLMLNCLASTNPCSPKDISDLLKGQNVSKFDAFKTGDIKSFDFASNYTNVANMGQAAAKAWADSTTFTNCKSNGKWDQFSNVFAKMSGSGATNFINNPSVLRSQLKQAAADDLSGITTAFDSFKQGNAVSVMAQFAGQALGTTFSDAQFKAFKKMMDAQASSFVSMASSKFAALGEALFNSVNGAQGAALTAIQDNPSVFMKKYIDNPGAYTGTAGATACTRGYETFIQNPTSFTSASGCSADTDCTGGQICAPAKFCMASCSTNCGYGSTCTTNGQCQTGVCNAAGMCGVPAGVDAIGTGGTAVTLLGMNQACTAATQCYSQVCSSGFCSAPVVVGAPTQAGFYKKTSGQSPTCTVAIQIDSAGGPSVISFQPSDFANPSSNTFFGGGITLTGSGSPFSIVTGNIIQGSNVGTIKCDGTSSSTALTLSSGRLTGTCALTATSGTFPATCTIDHTKL